MDRYEDRMVRVLKSDRLPELKRPAWLTEDVLDIPVPIRDLLTDSVFYSASGDEDHIRALATLRKIATVLNLDAL